MIDTAIEFISDEHIAADQYLGKSRGANATAAINPTGIPTLEAAALPIPLEAEKHQSTTGVLKHPHSKPLNNNKNKGEHGMTTGKLTVITSDQPATLGKVFSLSPDGTLRKETAGHMTVGSYEVREFSTAAEFVSLLSSVTTSQAIMSSLPKLELPQSGALVSSKLQTKYPRAITRSKSNFEFRPNAPGVLTLDYDPQAGDVVLSAADLWALLQNTVQGLQTAGVIHWLSGSSHIWHGEHELQGRRGQRVYILVADAGDIPRACEILATRLWLAGHGRIMISKSGAMLSRHVFDDALARVSQLDFCGGAVCNSPLEQRRGSPTILSDGGFLDSRAALPELTSVEVAKVDALQRAAKDASEHESKLRREAWTSAQGESLSRRLVNRGLPIAEAHERATHAARAAVGGVLLGDYLIVLESGGEISIGEILDAREKYHGAICLDPLEPDYQGGKPVGKLYLYGGSPTLHSFAHGCATYRLCRQPARIHMQSGRRAESADEILAHLAGENDLYVKGGVLVRLVKGRLVAIKRSASLSYLVGVRFALFKRSRDGKDVAVDLDDQTSNMLLAALGA